MRFLVAATALLCCLALYAQQGFRELFPVKTDADNKKITSPNGKPLKTTGRGACNWFIYHGAPETKIYKPRKGTLVVLFFWGVRNQEALSCLQLRLYIKEGESFYKMCDLAGPDLREAKDDPGYRIFAYHSSGKPLMVEGFGNGCYLRVFELGGKTPPVKLDAATEKKLNKLLERLWGDEWRKRRKAERELAKIALKDAKVLRFLQKRYQDVCEPWRKIPLLRVLWRASRSSEEGITVGSEGDLRAHLERLLLWALKRVRNGGDVERHAQQAIEWGVALDVRRGMELLHHRYPEARLAALKSLARTKADLKAALTAYRDRSYLLRLESIKILARYPTNKDARDALHELAENDPNKRVRLAAEDALDVEGNDE